MSDDLAKQLRTDAEAYRQSLAAPTSHDMFTLAYQWQDKKHRHVWDLCDRLETAADRIEKLEAALRNTTQFMEHYSYVWDGFNGTHPAILIDEARKALEGKDD